MVFNENDIRQMVTECVSMLLERHGAIDERLEGLADLIIKKFEEGGGKITPEELSQFNKYFNCNRPLNVIVGTDGRDAAAYYRETNTIKIDKNSFFTRNDRLKEAIMHELSHFVDQNMRTVPDYTGKFYNDSSYKAKIANDIMYYFRPTEMQARLTQFKYAIKKDKSLANRPLSAAESILKIKEMKYLISVLLSERFNNHYMGVLHRISFMQSATRAQNRGNGISNAGFINGFRSKNDFLTQKEKIIHKLGIKLRNYINKASKIKFDALSEND